MPFKSNYKKIKSFVKSSVKREAVVDRDNRDNLDSGAAEVGSNVLGTNEEITLVPPSKNEKTTGSDLGIAPSQELATAASKEDGFCNGGGENLSTCPPPLPGQQGDGGRDALEGQFQQGLASEQAHATHDKDKGDLADEAQSSFPRQHRSRQQAHPALHMLASMADQIQQAKTKKETTECSTLGSAGVLPGPPVCPPPALPCDPPPQSLPSLPIADTQDPLSSTVETCSILPPPCPPTRTVTNDLRDHRPQSNTQVGSPEAFVFESLSLPEPYTSRNKKEASPGAVLLALQVRYAEEKQKDKKNFPLMRSLRDKIREQRNVEVEIRNLQKHFDHALDNDDIERCEEIQEKLESLQASENAKMEELVCDPHVAQGEERLEPPSNSRGSAEYNRLDPPACPPWPFPPSGPPEITSNLSFRDDNFQLAAVASSSTSTNTAAGKELVKSNQHRPDSPPIEPAETTVDVSETGVKGAASFFEQKICKHQQPPISCKTGKKDMQAEPNLVSESTLQANVVTQNFQVQVNEPTESTVDVSATGVKGAASFFERKMIQKDPPLRRCKTAAGAKAVNESQTHLTTAANEGVNKISSMMNDNDQLCEERVHLLEDSGAKGDGDRTIDTDVLEVEREVDQKCIDNDQERDSPQMKGEVEHEVGDENCFSGESSKVRAGVEDEVYFADEQQKELKTDTEHQGCLDAECLAESRGSKEETRLNIMEVRTSLAIEKESSGEGLPDVEQTHPKMGQERIEVTQLESVESEGVERLHLEAEEVGVERRWEENARQKAEKVAQLVKVAIDQRLNQELVVDEQVLEVEQKVETEEKARMSAEFLMKEGCCESEISTTVNCSAGADDRESESDLDQVKTTSPIVLSQMTHADVQTLRSLLRKITPADVHRLDLNAVETSRIVDILLTPASSATGKVCPSFSNSPNGSKPISEGPQRKMDFFKSPSQSLIGRKVSRAKAPRRHTNSGVGISAIFEDDGTAYPEKTEGVDFFSSVHPSKSGF